MATGATATSRHRATLQRARVMIVVATERAKIAVKHPQTAARPFDLEDVVPQQDCSPFGDGGLPQALQRPRAHRRREGLQRTAEQRFDGRRQRHHEEQEQERRQRPQQEAATTKEPTHTGQPDGNRVAVKFGTDKTARQ